MCVSHVHLHVYVVWMCASVCMVCDHLFLCVYYVLICVCVCVYVCVWCALVCNGILLCQ